MNILMTYCNSMQENALPMGMSQLIACLHQAGYTVEFFDTTFYRWEEKSAMQVRMEHLQFPPCEIRHREGDVYDDFRNKIEATSPDLIGLSLVEPTFLLGMQLLESVRDLLISRNIKVAVGGVHAIYHPESLINNELIDFICIGEGEISFVELCRRLEHNDDPSDVQGFIVKNRKGCVRNTLRKPVDINMLPILDFDFFGPDFMLKPMMGRLHRTISVELTRGCPYTCTYCGNAWLTKIFKEFGGWYRLKRIEKIHQEYEEYIDKYNPQFIYKHSESFLAVDEKRFGEYMDMYSAYRIPYWIETRPEDVTDKKAERLANSNCKRISIGLESGNESYRKTMLKRSYTNDQVIRSCAILKDNGISFSMNLIIGLPMENREMVFEGVNLLRSVKPDGITVLLYTPYHGSSLRQVCIDKGMIEPDFICGDYFQMKYSLKNNTMNPKEVQGLLRTIPLYVHLPKSEYSRIRRSEEMNEKGNEIYNELKEEYYEIMGWNSAGNSR